MSPALQSWRHWARLAAPCALQQLHPHPPPARAAATRPPLPPPPIRPHQQAAAAQAQAGAAAVAAPGAAAVAPAVAAPMAEYPWLVGKAVEGNPPAAWDLARLLLAHPLLPAAGPAAARAPERAPVRPLPPAAAAAAWATAAPRQPARYAAQQLGPACLVWPAVVARHPSRLLPLPRWLGWELPATAACRLPPPAACQRRAGP